MHILIPVGMRMPMPMIVSVAMLERKNTNEVHCKAGNTDY